ncbi:aspartyl protease family protein, partial [Candidatus Dependentiae bacterium]|nr:aspartyl protease family protein [Candidatus Dependentiae bacterium]
MNKKYLVIFLIIMMMFTIPVFSHEDDHEDDHEDVNVKGTINDAETYFAQGEFEKAGAIYKAINKKDPKNYEAQIGHSRCAILKNHLGCAFRYSNKALELKPDNIEPKYNLAKIYYRVGKFDKALPYFKELKNEVMITKLEGFYDLKPFEISPESTTAEVKFISMEPVPIIEISINGNKKEKFIIDTGVKETLLDVSYAKEIRAKFSVNETGPLLSSKEVTFGHGILESIKIGNITVKNVPIHVVNFENVKLNKLTDEGVKGILGVSFLSNFIFTIDPINELFILRYIDSQEEFKTFNEAIEKSNAKIAPFYLTLENEVISK